jgi:SAM-dependent methyltransferase
MNCKFCNTSIMDITFDLGSSPASNSLVSKEFYLEKENTYPLVLYTCPKCFLVQIDVQLSGAEIFNNNYVYFSSMSSYWVSHAKNYSKEIINKLQLDSASFVVEIASNDGYLLKNFVQRGISCLGIEPAKGTAAAAQLVGVPTLVEFFNLELAEKLCAEDKQADLIIANNVLAHVPSINDFILAFKKLLKIEGTVTIEFPHVLSMVEQKEFDTIYHEHFFYFSLFTLKHIFSEHGLSIYDVDQLQTHGGSLRIYATHKGNFLDKKSIKKNVSSLIEKELKHKINSIEFYSRLKKDAQNIKLKALEYLKKEKSMGSKIIAFGAAAKGNTFLNFSGISSDIIDFVVDETPYKIGKFMPQSKIPIYSFEKIVQEKPNLIVILPWNHKKEIVEKLLFTKQWNAKLVVFIPELEVF